MFEQYCSFPVLVVSVIAIGLYFLLRKNPRIKRCLDQIEGPPSFPVIGSVLTFLRPHEDYFPMFDEWIGKYRHSNSDLLFKIWIGFMPYVGILDLKALEKVLCSATHNVDKGREYSLLYPWLGTGLLTAPKGKWAARRKLISPSFHFKILDEFVPIFNEQASVLVKCLEKESELGKRFDIYPYITRCTLDVICETAMGKKIYAQTSSSNKKYIDSVEGISHVFLQKSCRPWLQIPFIYWFSSISKLEKEYLKNLKGFTGNVIQSRKAERLEHRKTGKPSARKEEGDTYGKERKAFLDLLLDCSESGNLLSDEDIREEVDTFMFEGHDTTGLNLTWTILMLSLHPEYQTKVQNELDEIFSDDPERDITTSDFPRMKYLEYCIKETLRLYPSVPFILRQIDKDILVGDGRTIPRGVVAMIPIYYLHRDPVSFPDPLVFNPERFTLENSVGRHPLAFIPFSAGSRNCIGQRFALMEAKIVLAKLLRTYTFEVGQKMEDLRIVPDITLRSTTGIHVVLRKRR